MVRPENLGGDDKLGPNPTWFVGNGWRFGPSLNSLSHSDSEVTAKLDLYCADGGGVTIELSDKQIAKLQYAGQVGELNRYGEDHLGHDADA